jgi:hypothetical protein
MTAQTMKRGTLVVIGGTPCRLTGKPQRAINGTWLVFFELPSGKVEKVYATTDEMEGWMP